MSGRRVWEQLGVFFVVLAAFGSATASSPVIVPFRVAGHFPIVIAKVDGVDVPLAFGSGDSFTVRLEQSVLDQIKAAPIDGIAWGLDAKGHLNKSTKFRVSRLQLGDAVFNDVVALLDVHSRTYHPPKVGQKGWLGTGLLKSYEVVLDYPHLTMTLVPRAANDTPSEQCRGTSVPFAVKEQPAEPFTKADTDMGQLTLVWDSGSQLSMVGEKVIQRGLVQASNEDVTTKRLVVGGTDFGPWQFKWMEMSLPPFFDGSIGYDFLATHVVCFDFPDKRVVIRP
jgi:hypothetical protein